MITALENFKKTATVPALAGALIFNPATSQNAEAALVTLDFEQFSSLTQNTGAVLIPDFDESGFHIADSDDGLFSALGDLHPDYIGDVAIATTGGAKTVVTENNATNFRVHSILLSTANASLIELGGINSLGQNFSESYSTNGLNLQEIFLSSAFDNVQAFEALHKGNGENFFISEITVDTEATVVPVPAAAYLFGSALVGFGAARKYKQPSTPKTELNYSA